MSQKVDFPGKRTQSVAQSRKEMKPKGGRRQKCIYRGTWSVAQGAPSSTLCESIRERRVCVRV